MAFSVADGERDGPEHRRNAVEDMGKGIDMDRITVPELSAVELVALVNLALTPVFVAPGLMKWDFVLDERGKVYEVLVLEAVRRPLRITEITAHFKSEGFSGNTAAFVAWVVKNKPRTCCITIPENDRLHKGVDRLSMPYFYSGPRYQFDFPHDATAGESREFGLAPVGNYYAGYSILAFREVK